MILSILYHSIILHLYLFYSTKFSINFFITDYLLQAFAVILYYNYKVTYS
jgi:hypothetical protein